MPPSRRRCHRLERFVVAALAPLSLLIGSLPARAALVNTYSATDDVWIAPIPSGRFLLDARISYGFSRPSQLVLPAVSLAYGLVPSVELGVAGSYTLTDLWGGKASQAPSVLSPYLKVQSPFTLGATTFGLVVGAQVPARAGMERTVAVEGAAAIALSSTTSLDLSLGVGQTFLAPALLTHVNAALYHTLPTGQTLSAEAYAYAPSSGGPTYGQQVGVLTQLYSSLTADLSVALSETAAGLGAIIPQVGATWTW